MICLVGGCEDCTPKHYKVECRDSEETVLCYSERSCQATAKDVCATYLHDGDLSKAYLYPDAVFVEIEEACGGELPAPPCVCDYGGVYPNTCEPPGATSTSGGTSEGTGTTEEPEPEPDFWVCGTHTQAKCVDVNYVNDPFIDPVEHCWTNPNYPNEYQRCAFAADATEARLQCEDWCNDHRQDVEADVAVWNEYNETNPKAVVNAIDCLLDDSPAGDAVFLKEAPWVCTPITAGPLAPWGGSTTLVPASAVVAMTTSEGEFTGQSGLIGYIGYEITGCGGGTCEVMIDALEMVATDVAGTLYDAAGPVASYSLEALDLSLRQAVYGVYNESSYGISFPGDPFAATIEAADLELDSVSLGPWSSLEVIHQASGSVDPTTDVLTLNFTVNGDGGVLTVALETVE